MDFEYIFMGWCFVSSNVRGRLGGLAIGINQKNIKVLGSWGFNVLLGANIFFNLSKEVKVVNIYNPCPER